MKSVLDECAARQPASDSVVPSVVVEAPVAVPVVEPAKPVEPEPPVEEDDHFYVDFDDDDDYMAQAIAESKRYYEIDKLRTPSPDIIHANDTVVPTASALSHLDVPSSFPISRGCNLLYRCFGIEVNYEFYCNDTWTLYELCNCMICVVGGVCD